MTIKSEFNELAPGILLFESDVPKNAVSHLNYADNYIKNNGWVNDFTKNTLWEAFNRSNDLDFLTEIQNNILSSLALYCDVYDEAIHSIQWQEKIVLSIDGAGSPEKVFNPSKSSLVDNNIDQVPFSRQVCIEYFINDDYDGGSISWNFFDLKNFKPKSGDILVYPGFFLYTKKVKPVIKNKKIVLFTSFNGGKDFVSENRSMNFGHNDLIFSYMR